MNDATLASSFSSRWLRASPLLVALAIGSAGCEVQTSGSDDVEGSLTLDWTLDDTDDPVACDDYDARTLEIIVYDDYGAVAATVHPPCDAFEASIVLPDGVYSIDATLVDVWDLHWASFCETSAGSRISIMLVLIHAGFGTLLHIFRLF